jgi:ATP-dependent DNA helicase RecQ
LDLRLSLARLEGMSGLGVKKLKAYGPQVLRVCNGAT